MRNNFFIKFFFLCNIIVVTINADRSMNLSDVYKINHSESIESMINKEGCVFKLSDTAVKEHEAGTDSIFFFPKKKWTLCGTGPIVYESSSKSKRFKERNSNFKDLRFQLKDPINKGFGSNNDFIETNTGIGKYIWISSQLMGEYVKKIEVVCSSCSSVCIQSADTSLMRQIAGGMNKSIGFLEHRNDFADDLSPQSFFTSNSTPKAFFTSNSMTPKSQTSFFSANSKFPTTVWKERESFMKGLGSVVQSYKWTYIGTPENTVGLHFHREIILPAIVQSRVLDSTKWPSQTKFDLSQLNPTFQYYNAISDDLKKVFPGHNKMAEQNISLSQSEVIKSFSYDSTDVSDLYFFEYVTKTLPGSSNFSIKTFLSGGRVQHLQNGRFQQTHDAIASIRVLGFPLKVPGTVSFMLEPFDDGIGNKNQWRLIVRAMLNPSIPWALQRFKSYIAPTILAEVNHQDSPFTPMMEKIIEKFVDNYWENE